MTDAERCWNKTCATPKTAEGAAKPAGYIDPGAETVQNAVHLREKRRDKRAKNSRQPAREREPATRGSRLDLGSGSAASSYLADEV
jgi:hypothetical protein